MPRKYRNICYTDIIKTKDKEEKTITISCGGCCDLCISICSKINNSIVYERVYPFNLVNLREIILDIAKYYQCTVTNEDIDKFYEQQYKFFSTASSFKQLMRWRIV